MGEKTDNVWAGFDLGGTKMLAVILDEELKPLGRKRRKTRGFEGADAGLERISETIQKALTEAELSPQNLKGIGIGCPGLLDLDKGIINEAPNLGWEKAAICDFLKKKFDVPVILMNDVDAGLYGEFQFGAARGSHNALGIFPGTGIGGAFLYEGRILQGKGRSCMEIGHIRVMPDGPLCGCGRHGCLEAVASRLAISSAIAQAAFRGQAPFVKEKAGTDLSEIRSGLIAEAVKQDPVVDQIVRQAARQIGLAAGSLVHLLSPDRIVLGGGLVEALPQLFRQEVKAGVEEWILASFKDSFKIVVAELGDDAAVMGAAAFARNFLKQT
ncbi:MAG TPA: ROK family protein [Planctomycetaceae bacterium]|nr:ROK family protein [Planctomycetaceae bacterium]